MFLRPGLYGFYSQFLLCYKVGKARKMWPIKGSRPRSHKAIIAYLKRLIERQMRAKILQLGG